MRTRRVSSCTQNMHEKNEKFLFLGVSLTPSFREVDVAIGMVGTAIVDANVYPAAVSELCYLYARSERQCKMRCRHNVFVEGLAVGRLMSMAFRSVPRRSSLLLRHVGFLRFQIALRSCPPEISATFDVVHHTNRLLSLVNVYLNELRVEKCKLFRPFALHRSCTDSVLPTAKRNSHV